MKFVLINVITGVNVEIIDVNVKMASLENTAKYKCNVHTIAQIGVFVEVTVDVNAMEDSMGFFVNYMCLALLIVLKKVKVNVKIMGRVSAIMDSLEMLAN
jgi:hypothetical protein